jgi:hypothetical protein
MNYISVRDNVRTATMLAGQKKGRMIYNVVSCWIKIVQIYAG